MPKTSKKKRSIGKKTDGASNTNKHGSTTTIGDQPPVANIHLEGVGKPEFDILLMPKYQLQVADRFDEEILPLQAAAGDSSVVSFEIRGTDAFLNIHETELVVQYKYVNKDTGLPIATSIQGNKKNFRRTYEESQIIHSLWQTVEVAINNQSINSHVHSYPIKAQLDTLLQKDKQQQKVLGYSSHFEKDTDMDTDWDAHADTLYTTKPSREMRLIKTGSATTTYTVRDKLHHFLFEQDKCIPPKIDIRLVLTKAREEFYLKTFEDDNIVRLKIEKMYLKIVRQKLNPKYHLHILDVWSRSKARYPLRRNEVRYHNIPQGQSEYTAQSVFSGVSPTQIIVGFLHATNFAGHHQRSLFNFTNSNVEDIHFEKNGKRIPTLGYKKLDFPNAVNTGSALAPFKALMDIGKRQGHDINISYPEYCESGYSLFSFDFTPDVDEAGSDAVFSSVNTAPINMFVNFKPAPDHAINVILYSFYDSLLEISKDGHITYNWMG